MYVCVCACVRVIHILLFPLLAKSLLSVRPNLTPKCSFVYDLNVVFSILLQNLSVVDYNLSTCAPSPTPSYTH
eukprot:m.175300 g.175300  ORF g.175300 m.175300 type:complete len:73 (+) comp13966_c0_seq1:1763-1981(+)